jgi:hypothetical protein
VRRNRIPFDRPGLFQKHLTEVRDADGQQFCLLFLGSKENKIDQTFGHSRCQVGNIDLLLPLNVLLNQIRRSTTTYLYPFKWYSVASHRSEVRHDD